MPQKHPWMYSRLTFTDVIKGSTAPQQIHSKQSEVYQDSKRRWPPHKRIANAENLFLQNIAKWNCMYTKRDTSMQKSSITAAEGVSHSQQVCCRLVSWQSSSRYQDTLSPLAPDWWQVCCKLSTGLLQVHCQNFVCTSLMHAVSTTSSKSGHITLHQGWFSLAWWNWMKPTGLMQLDDILGPRIW